MSLALQKIPRISLSFKLVPVLYRECRCGLFSPLDVPAWIPGSCIYHLGLDICFDHREMVMKPGKHLRNKDGKIYVGRSTTAYNLLFCQSYTMHELRNQHVSIG